MKSVIKSDPLGLYHGLRTSSWKIQVDFIANDPDRLYDNKNFIVNDQGGLYRTLISDQADFVEYFREIRNRPLFAISPILHIKKISLLELRNSFCREICCSLFDAISRVTNMNLCMQKNLSDI